MNGMLDARRSSTRLRHSPGKRRAARGRALPRASSVKDTPSETVVRTNMKSKSEVKDGDRCDVVGGTHAGKWGSVRDVNTSNTGHVTITVVQENGERFKTLAKNVVVQGKRRTQ